MTTINFKVTRAGYAEEFVRNLQGTIPQMLDSTLDEITADIASEAPKKSGELAASFYKVPVQQVGEGGYQGGVASTTPAKARALEYGSGIHGARKDKYPIYPRNARFLSFEKEGKTLILPMVMHPGVRARHYIKITLSRWGPLLAQKLGKAIKLALVPSGKVPY